MFCLRHFHLSWNFRQSRPADQWTARDPPVSASQIACAGIRGIFLHVFWGSNSSLPTLPMSPALFFWVLRQRLKYPWLALNLLCSKDDLDFTIPQLPPECWDYRSVPPHLVLLCTVDRTQDFMQTKKALEQPSCFPSASSKFYQGRSRWFPPSKSHQLLTLN